MLYGWGSRGHDDSRRDLELTSRVCNPLGVVTCAGSARKLGSIWLFAITSRTGHYALPAVLRVHVRHFVVGPSKLEAEHGLEVLPF